MAARHSFSALRRTLSNTNELRQIDDNLLTRLIRTQDPSPRTLEEIIDVNRDLEIYNNHQLTLLNPRTLYRTGFWSINPQLVRISREEEVCVTTEYQNIGIVSHESINQLLRNHNRFIHLGLIIIGIKGLARRNLGTKVLITLLDKRWASDARKAIIASMEIDMSDNKGIFYCAPDFLLSIRDLENIVIGIQSKGYETFTGKANLLINVGFLGKVTNSSTTKYKININAIIESMTSKGIRMIKPMAISSEELEGLDWNISKNLEVNTSMKIPEESLMFRNPNGSYTVRFLDYREKIPSEENETEEFRSQIED